MKRMVSLLLFSLLLTSLEARASLPGLADVLSARGLLSPGTWSRVLRLELPRREGAYSKSFYALVFEAASALWIYSPEEGTQSLSTHVGRTEQDKLALSPLLEEVHPTLRSWTEEARPEALLAKQARGARKGSLPQEPRNACFIQSLALLEQRCRLEGAPTRASLFTYYVSHRGRRQGHTVLLYSHQGRSYVADPAFPGQTRELDARESGDFRRLGASLAGGHALVSVRDLPLPRSSYPELQPLPEGTGYAVAEESAAGGERPATAGGASRVEAPVMSAALN